MEPLESSDATIRRVLSAYELGRKIRALRLRKKIALVDLGKHTGLSASLLSQLENGKLLPTLPTLARIAMVFDVGLEHFFAPTAKRKPFSIVRAAERIRFPDNPDTDDPQFFFECLAFHSPEKTLQAYMAEFMPRSQGFAPAPHKHDGAEFLHIIAGQLQVRYQEEDYFLHPGDSVYFDSSEDHSYLCLSPEPAKAIVITTPPRL